MSFGFLRLIGAYFIFMGRVILSEKSHQSLVPCPAFLELFLRSVFLAKIYLTDVLLKSLNLCIFIHHYAFLMK